MDSELPFHRIIFFPDVELKFPRCDPKMDILSTLFFVESAIDHVLRTHLFVFDWPMPVNLKLLEQKIPDKTFFDSVIGKAITHNCAMSFSLDIAQTHGFTVETWSRLEGREFRDYTQYYLDVVRSETKTANLSLIHMLSFAIFLTSLAVEVGSKNLINDIVWSIVHKLGESFPYEWIYESLHHWALTYNFRHNDIDETWMFEDYIEEGLDEVAGHLIIDWRG
ncbi:hypothetical protein AVEN_108882-1 [Araneus ventricosus]|uniref:Uncharacterized protein n=1 Tax=Araneus ventricosus TaxID=182803 RepID=A0A4Y2BWU9_ARAVE|nr:hypothetical protein AVEN_108882-1 [Araneus ventricosus]